MANTNGESSYQHLTDIQVTKCLALAKSGMKQRAIATEIACSKSTVGCLSRFGARASRSRSASGLRPNISI